MDSRVDADMLDTLTSLELLQSGKTSRPESQAYEDVVRARLTHQYWSERSAEPKALNAAHPSFFDNVEEAIHAALRCLLNFMERRRLGRLG